MERNFIELDISNPRHLEQFLQNLSQIDRDKAIKGGLSKGGEVLKRGGIKRLKKRMKSGPDGVKGNLLKSFFVRVKRKKPGVLAGFTQGRNGGNHAHLVDLGTTQRMRKSNNRRLRWKGGSTGAATANYFWTETREADMGKAKEEVSKGLIMFVEKIKARG